MSLFCVEVSTAFESTAIGGSRLYPADYLHAIGCFTTNTDSGVARNTLPFLSIYRSIYLSKQAKICIVWELTAPLEENIEKRHASKTAKYQRELVDNGQAGWTIHIVCGEIGAKGWVPPTFTNDLRTVFGLPKRQRTKLANNCAWVARQCSYVIWLNRNNRAFEPFPVQPPKAHDK